MHIHRRLKAYKFFASALLICLCWLMAPSPVLAYNYLFVNTDEGKPLGWEPGTTITYYLDPGPLGILTNEQAHTLLKATMNIWESVPNANVPHFEFGGYLPEDVDGTNYQKYVSSRWCHMDDLSACSTDYQKNLQTVIIFDDDKYILNNELCRIGGCRAQSGPDVFDGTTTQSSTFRQGHIVFGRDVLAGGTADAVGVFVHELGHLLGLAHPSINQQLLLSIIDEIDDPNLYLPSMHTKGFFTRRTDLTPDDIAGIQTLYPADSTSTQLGSIRGNIFKADGSPMTYANIIVRDVTDPWCKAYAYMSGRNHCMTASASVCERTGKADGSFSIDSLPPGSYTVEVEGFSKDLDDYTISVSPMIIDGDLPGNAEFWNDGDSANEDPLTQTVITLSTGEVRDNINITLNDTQYHDVYAVMIPASAIPVVANTACTVDPTDWNSVAGIQAPSNTTTPPAGGCSLIPR